MEPDKTDRFKAGRAEHPPIQTVMVELVGWGFDRTAGFPKSQRFTFGQRLDNLALDGLGLVTRALSTGKGELKVSSLEELALLLEQMRALWRLACDRGWLSRQQLLHVCGRLDEVGRMAAGWRKHCTLEAVAGMDNLWRAAELPRRVVFSRLSPKVARTILSASSFPPNPGRSPPKVARTILSGSPPTS